MPPREWLQFHTRFGTVPSLSRPGEQDELGRRRAGREVLGGKLMGPVLLDM